MTPDLIFKQKLNIYDFVVDFFVSVLLSAHIERFSFSRMQDFSLFLPNGPYTLVIESKLNNFLSRTKPEIPTTNTKTTRFQIIKGWKVRRHMYKNPMLHSTCHLLSSLIPWTIRPQVVFNTVIGIFNLKKVKYSAVNFFYYIYIFYIYIYIFFFVIIHLW